MWMCVCVVCVCVVCVCVRVRAVCGACICSWGKNACVYKWRRCCLCVYWHFAGALAFCPKVKTLLASALHTLPACLCVCIFYIFYIYALADLLSSDLQWFRLYIFNDYKHVCSLGIEPTTFCAAKAMPYHWATGTHVYIYSISQKWVHPSHFCKYCIISFHVTTLKKWHFSTM